MVFTWTRLGGSWKKTEFCAGKLYLPQVLQERSAPSTAGGAEGHMEEERQSWVEWHCLGSPTPG